MPLISNVRAHRMPRRLVIFDIDETLVHATMNKLPVEHDFVVGRYFIHERPHLRRLLEFASARFDLAVWSSSSTEYVAAVVERLFSQSHQLKFVWSVDRCTQRTDPKTNGYVYIKDLRKIQGQGYALDRVTIVDDSPEKIQRQPRNHLLVKPYLGEPEDNELLKVEAQLAALDS